MKRIILTLTVGVLTLGGFAQDNDISVTNTTPADDEVKTLLGEQRVKGFYVGVSSQAFQLNGDLGYGIGGEWGMVISRKFNMGMTGNVLLTNVYAPYEDATGTQYYYDLGYGGLLIEPMFKSVWPVHISMPVVLGVGAASQSKYRAYDYYLDFNSSSDFRSDMFLVGQAGINVEANIFKFLRLAAGVNYRLTSDVELLGGSPQQLSGLGGNVTLRLGWF